MAAKNKAVIKKCNQKYLTQEVLNQSTQPEYSTKVLNQSTQPEYSTKVLNQSTQPEYSTRVLNQSTQPMRQKDWLTQKQFAEIEGISYQAVYKNLKQGKYLKTREVPAKSGRKKTRIEIHVSCLSESQAPTTNTPEPERQTRSSLAQAPAAARTEAPMPPTPPAQPRGDAPDGAGRDACAPTPTRTRLGNHEYWLSVGEFVALTTYTSRHVRRKYAGDSADPSLYRHNNGVLEIHAHALPAKALWLFYAQRRMPVPEYLTKQWCDNLDQVPEQHRQTAFARLDVLRRFDGFLFAYPQAQEQAARLFCADSRDGVSWSTLLGWRRAYEKYGVRGLVPKQVTRGASKAEIQKAALAFLFKHYLFAGKPNKTASAKALEVQAAARGWTVPGRRTLIRRLTEIPGDVFTLYQHGRKALDNMFLPSSERRYDFPSMMYWSSDHHQLDIHVLLPNGRVVRPWLTCWVDVRARKVLAWMVCLQPDSTTIAQCFYEAVKRFGSPFGILLDNGRDYKCYKLVGDHWKKKKFKLLSRQDEVRLRGAFEACGVRDIMFAIPGNAKSKPVERWFRTLEEQCVSQLPGYCGSGPKERPAKLDREIAQGRLLLFDKADELIGRYIAETYNQAEHSGKGMHGRSPDVCFVEERQEVGRVPEENLKLLFLQPKEAVLQKQGIKFLGQWYYNEEIQHRYFDPTAGNGKGIKIWLRYDKDDLSSIAVYDRQTDTKLGEAALRADFGHKGLRSEDEIKTRKRMHRRQRALIRAWQEEYLGVQQVSLDDDLTPEERIGLTDRPAQPETQDRGNEPVHRMIPKTPSQAVKDAAKLGDAVKDGVIDMAAVRDRRQQLEAEQDETRRELRELERIEQEINTFSQRSRKAVNDDSVIAEEIREKLGF